MLIFLIVCSRWAVAAVLLLLSLELLRRRNLCWQGLRPQVRVEPLKWSYFYQLRSYSLSLSCRRTGVINIAKVASHSKTEVFDWHFRKYLEFKVVCVRLNKKSSLLSSNLRERDHSPKLRRNSFSGKVYILHKGKKWFLLGIAWKRGPFPNCLALNVFLVYFFTKIV